MAESMHCANTRLTLAVLLAGAAALLAAAAAILWHLQTAGGAALYSPAAGCCLLLPFCVCFGVIGGVATAVAGVVVCVIVCGGMDDKDEQSGRSGGPVPRERVGVAGIWCRDGRVLLTRRAEGIPYGNLWCFPGGGIEPGEDETQALLREWREELGTGVRLIRKIGSSEVSGGRFLLHWYLVEGEDGSIEPNPAEVAEVRWIEVKDLPDMPDLLESNRQLVREVGVEGLGAGTADKETRRQGDKEQRQSGREGEAERGRNDNDHNNDRGNHEGYEGHEGKQLQPQPGAAVPQEQRQQQPRLAPGASDLLDGPVGPTIWRDLQEQLEDLRRGGMYRSLRTVDSPVGRMIRVEGRGEVVNFASNDYLGLAGDPRIAAAVGEALERWGWGAGASQLVCGRTSVHAELEAAIARFEGTEAAIVLPTGYMANLAAIRTLAGPEDVILLDKLNHASIIDAAGSAGAQMRVFPHRNYRKLATLLERYAGARRRIIVTDTVFSMDGDVADLVELVRLKRQYGAVLIVDEAHATGVLGAGGRGLAELQGVEGQIDVTVGTLSKALGGIGGFVAGARVLIDMLVNLARPYIFTTGQPAAACAAAMRALEIVRDEPWRRERALGLAERLRERLRAAGWNCGDSRTQIVPVIVGQAERAVALSGRLLEAGYFAPAIRPPAVPPDGSRLRVSVTASHTEEDVDGLAERLTR